MGLCESKMGVGSPRVRGSWVYAPNRRREHPKKPARTRCCVPGCGVRVAPPGGLLSAAGVLGAAVFLALSMDAPLSSVALVVGFTGQSWGAYVPLAVAVGVAWGVKRLWEAHRAWVLAGA